MNRPPHRINRIALALVGLVLLAGGVLALLRGTGFFGAAGPDAALLVPGERHYAAASGWVWPAVGAAAALLAVAGLVWALAQLRRAGVRTIALEADLSRGATRLSAVAVTDALEDELQSYRGVHRARARLIHSSRHPRLDLRITLAADADPRPIRARIEQQALTHLRRVLDQEDLPARIRLDITPRPAGGRIG
ncbi:alkaline shock response membrane anchor protein AmaP [Streptomyces sp. RPT161]|uniref:alkaline shock response membrane anchor protein AmaP n=1 Tax=Streptomyces sp. RPT161 TaxID=3015993 RepID=UPI0022B916FE|nr:alkaline shock response membrane anchor protein AmaP [Streptomyces sp. RPT161]